jgi:hypothetical protein
MKEQIYTNVKLSKNQKTLIVTQGKEVAFISANLIKHLLEIPYTKKDGTLVSLENIKALKAKSKAAYAQAVLENSKKTVEAGA